MPVNDHLLTRRSREDHAAALQTATAEVGRYLDRRITPRSPAPPSHLAAQTAAVDLASPLGSLEQALHEARRLYLDHAVGYHHPRYLAHLNCPVTIPALAAEILATSVNTAVETWDQGTSACLIEQKLIDWVTGLINFEGAELSGRPSRPGAVRPDGGFTTGGTQSNLQGLFTAREDRLGRPAPGNGAGAGAEVGAAVGNGTGVSDRGMRLSRLRIVTGQHAHMSVVMAARLLGLAPDAVVTVPCRNDMVDPTELDHALGRIAESGDEVAAVVAVAGTTDHGAIDPLTEIGEVCRRHDVWLHVDAAYGGGLLVSPAHRDLLDGIDRADSVTVDFHKTFFLPVAASALLLRDGRGFRHSTVNADYLNPVDGDQHAVDKSLQTTRRFDALKLWMTLRVMGADGIGELLDGAIGVARRIGYTVESDPELELVRRPALSTVLFRPRPAGSDDDEVDHLVRAVRDALFAEGHSLVASTIVDGRPSLKLTVLDPNLGDEDVAAVLADVRGAAAYLANGLRQVTTAGALT